MKDKILAVYDKGDGSIDRYLVVLKEKNGNYHVGLLLSTNPDSPQGVSNFSDVVPGDHLGKEILFEDLPDQVREHVLERMA